MLIKTLFIQGEHQINILNTESEIQEKVSITITMKVLITIKIKLDQGILLIFYYML